jgi:hypothetical protein
LFLSKKFEFLAANKKLIGFEFFFFLHILNKFDFICTFSNS